MHREITETWGGRPGEPRGRRLDSYSSPTRAAAAAADAAREFDSLTAANFEAGSDSRKRGADNLAGIRRMRVHASKS